MTKNANTKELGSMPVPNLRISGVTDICCFFDKYACFCTALKYKSAFNHVMELETLEECRDPLSTVNYNVCDLISTQVVYSTCNIWIEFEGKVQF